MASQNVRVNTGGGSAVNNLRTGSFVGRDQINNYFGQDAGGTSFFLADYSQYGTQGASLPPIVDEIVDCLRERHFLVVIGDLNVDVSSLIRICAWRLKMRLAEASILEHNRPLVKEWNPGSVPLNFTQFLSEMTATVFVLPELQPYHIGFDPLNVGNKSKASGRHFILAAANRTDLHDWLRFTETENAIFLRKLTAKDAYPTTYLVDFVIAKIRADKHLHGVASDKELTAETLLHNQISILNVCQQLEVPNKIDNFLQRIALNEGSLVKHDLQRLLSQARNSDLSLKIWYSNLEKRKQLLLVALYLFEGLLDTQFFLVLEEVLIQKWRTRDPHLTMYDYDDLESLSTVVRLVQSRDLTKKIEFLDETYRAILRNLIWSTHRRYLTSALTVMVDLIMLSATDATAYPELFSPDSASGLSLFQQTASRALGEIGSLSSRSVETDLLRMAATCDIRVQMVTALAVAQWRQHDNSETLIRMLRDWQTEAKYMELMLSLLVLTRVVSGEAHQGVEADDQRFIVWTTIRITVAISLAFALQYDIPNTIGTESHALLSELMRDSQSNDDVKGHFLYDVKGHFLYDVKRLFLYTAWWVALQNHTKQTKELIESAVLMDIEFIIPTAEGLAAAIANDSENWEILDAWWNEWIDFQVTPPSEWPPKRREAIVATVAGTYVFLLQYNSGRAQNHQITIRQRLRQMLEDQKEHPFVRKFIWDSLYSVTKRDFSKTQEFLAGCLSLLTRHERERLIQLFTDVYLDQRQRQRGGDIQENLGNHEYNIWLYSPRPLTEIEHQVETWAANTGDSDTQEFALECQVSFARRFDNEEREAIKKLQTGNEKGQKASIDKRDYRIVTSRTPEDLELFVHKHSHQHMPELSRLRAFLLQLIEAVPTRRDQQFRGSIEKLTPVVLSQDQHQRDPLETALSRWAESSNTTVSQIGIELQRRLGLLRSPRITLVGVIVVIFAIVALVVMVSLVR